MQDPIAQQRKFLGSLNVNISPFADESQSIILGTYEIDQVRLASGNLRVQFERDPGQPVDKAMGILRHPRVTLFQRADAFDVRLFTCKHIQLDKNNSLELEISSGWNEITSCEMRIRAATGGLRLLMSEAKTIGSTRQLSQGAEPGLLGLQTIAANSSVRIRFPFTVEQELQSVSIKVEASYSTANGSFAFSSSPSASISLALSVNVQDVFKHKALLSKFSVSTASASPLRLFKSELADSDVFASAFGVPPSQPLTVFPKQPASLLYKITRKSNVKLGPGAQRIMYMKLYYTVLQDEIDLVLEREIVAALEDSPLWDFSRLIVSHVLAHARAKLTAYDLERVSLLGELPTSFLADVNWEKEFQGLGQAGDGVAMAKHLASFVTQWQKKYAAIRMEQPDPDTNELRSITIPVDIPSMTIVHTADIRLSKLPHRVGPAGDGQHPDVAATVNVNQLIPATLHLKWTRVWDTGGDGKSGPPQQRPSSEDLEFCFEVTAPPDTWLLGGRRKGHFVIPARDEAGSAGLSSTPDTEAEIPLLMVPLREGWLPYPHVEIREVTDGESDGHEPGEGGHGHCETDNRNLGETVRAIADRHQVTLSLDASGPGGGPLVLESEGRPGLRDVIANIVA